MATHSRRFTSSGAVALAGVLIIAFGVIVWFALRPSPGDGPPGTAGPGTSTPSAGSTTATPDDSPSTDSAPAPTPTGPLSSDPASSAGTPEAPASRARREVVLVVRTNGPTDIVHGVIGAAQTPVRVTDDWTLTLTLSDADTTVRVWATGAGASEVSCEILIDGVSVVQRNGVGVPPEAICAANVRLSG